MKEYNIEYNASSPPNVVSIYEGDDNGKRLRMVVYNDYDLARDVVDFLNSQKDIDNKKVLSTSV